MYEVTVKFKTKEEMLSFFNEAEADRKQDEKEVVEKAPAKKKTTKKAAKKVEPKKEEVKEAEIVQEPAAAPTPSQAAFNRDACLEKIGVKIKELQDGGMEGNDLANLIAGIFTDLGQPQCKISQLDDSTLINFSISFNKAVEATNAPASTGAAFI